MVPSVTGAYYRMFPQNFLQSKLYKLRPGVIKTNVLILHDKMRTHISAPVIKILEKYGWEWLHQSAYSPGYLLLKNANLALLGNKTFMLSKLTMLLQLWVLVSLKFCCKWTFIMTF